MFIQYVGDGLWLVEVVEGVVVYLTEDEFDQWGVPHDSAS